MLYEYLNHVEFLPIVIKIFAALIMGGLIGLERGIHGRAAGLRTHILVSIGAAMTAIISICIGGGDILRIPAQVVSGIGFLGVGTIIIRKDTVTGLTTAAGLWATAIIGIAVGFGLLEAAAICTLICILTTTILTRLEINQKAEKKLYAELNDAASLNKFIEWLESKYTNVEEISVVPCRSKIAGNIGVTLRVGKKGYNLKEIIGDILEFENALYAIED